MASNPHTSEANIKVAIIGGGLAGTAAASRLNILASSSGQSVETHIFDWGWHPGGRMAHRSVYVAQADGSERFQAPPEGSGDWWLLDFDHGSQFIRIGRQNDTPATAKLLGPLVDSKHLCHWLDGGSRLGWLSSSGAFVPQESPDARQLGEGFFGIMKSPKSHSHEIFASTTGMVGVCAVVQSMTKGLKVHQRCRVLGLRELKVHKSTAEQSKLAPAPTNSSTAEVSNSRLGRKWRLLGDRGHHEMSSDMLKVKGREEKDEDVLGDFDALILTEHMAWLPEWHPCCLHGLKDIFPKASAWVRERLGYNHQNRRFANIASLFTLMVGFPEDEIDVPFDAVCIESNTIQFAACQSSRPYAKKNDSKSHIHPADCWVVVSTEKFAEKCLEQETMSRKDSSGKIRYCPQEEKYLRSDPADIMLDEFLRLISRVRRTEGVKTKNSESKVIYKRCQRWGAAYPSTPTTKRKPTSKADGNITDHGMCWEIGNAGIVCVGDYAEDHSVGSRGRSMIEAAIASGFGGAEKILAWQIKSAA